MCSGYSCIHYSYLGTGCIFSYRDGIISGTSSEGKPRGAARYWGPLRAGKAWDRKIGNLS